jgi:hypothetical protein
MRSNLSKKKMSRYKHWSLIKSGLRLKRVEDKSPHKLPTAYEDLTACRR